MPSYLDWQKGFYFIRDIRGSLTFAEVTLNDTKMYVDPIVDIVEANRMKTGLHFYDALHGIFHVNECGRF